MQASKPTTSRPWRKAGPKRASVVGLDSRCKCSGEGAAFVYALGNKFKETDAEIRNFDSLRKLDREQVQEKLTAARKNTTENNYFIKLKTKEKTDAEKAVTKLEKLLEGLTEE